MNDDITRSVSPNGHPQEFDTEALARAMAEAAWELKARNVRVLDVRKLVSYADYLVVCHGTSERHAASIANHVIDDLRPLKVRPASVEGIRTGEWILVDFLDAVLHVFYEPFRSEYAIESIYREAPRLALEPPGELEEQAEGPDP